MRIVILGDFHLNASDGALTESAVDDIARIRPDLVVPLGDFGSRERIGRPQGLDESLAWLNRPGAPLRPIMGNHDLERESGGGPQQPGTMLRHFVHLFGQSPYGVLEYDFVRLFFASTDPQPADDCYSVQECYVCDEQFDWLRGQLSARPGVPVIFFTHAPPIGCGLRTVPDVHVRSTNAYLDQNHDPYRWLRLFRHTPEIVLWFSAHYHLGHVHPDARTFRYGTRFFMTGVHGDRTRDDLRQSRVLDVDARGIRVRTLDHVRSRLGWAGGWSCRGDWRRLVGRSAGYWSMAQTCPVGAAAVVADGVAALDNGRYLVATENGCCWEAEPASEAVLGTCYLGPEPVGVAVSQQRIWIAWGHEVGWIDRRSPWRFVRNAQQDGRPRHRTEFRQPVRRIAARQAGGIWVLAGDELWVTDWEPETAAIRTRRVATLQETSLSAKAPSAAAPSPAALHAEMPPAARVQLIGRTAGVAIVTGSGELLAYDETAGSVERLRDGVLAWDERDGREAVIVEGDDGFPVMESDDGQLRCRMSLAGYVTPDGRPPLPLLYLGDHRVVFISGKTAYCASVDDNGMMKLEGTGGRAMALSEPGNDGRNGTSSGTFAVALAPGTDGDHPRLQVWQRVPDGSPPVLRQDTNASYAETGRGREEPAHGRTSVD